MVSYVIRYYTGAKSHKWDVCAHSLESTRKLFDKLAAEYEPVYQKCKSKALRRGNSAFWSYDFAEFNDLETALRDFYYAVNEVFGVELELPVLL